MYVYLCVFGDSGGMMAKQSSVHALTCFSLDTCEDKHQYPWLTLTPCWVNTHLNSKRRSHIRHSDAPWARRLIHSRLASSVRPNKQRQFRVQSSLAAALPHIQPLSTTSHTCIMGYQLLTVNTVHWHGPQQKKRKTEIRRLHTLKTKYLMNKW